MIAGYQVAKFMQVITLMIVLSSLLITVDSLKVSKNNKRIEMVIQQQLIKPENINESATKTELFLKNKSEQATKTSAELSTKEQTSKQESTSKTEQSSKQESIVKGEQTIKANGKKSEQLIKQSESAIKSKLNSVVDQQEQMVKKINNANYKFIADVNSNHLPTSQQTISISTTSISNIFNPLFTSCGVICNPPNGLPVDVAFSSIIPSVCQIDVGKNSLKINVNQNTTISCQISISGMMNPPTLDQSVNWLSVMSYLVIQSITKMAMINQTKIATQCSTTSSLDIQYSTVSNVIIPSMVSFGLCNMNDDQNVQSASQCNIATFSYDASNCIQQINNAMAISCGDISGFLSLTSAIAGGVTGGAAASVGLAVAATVTGMQC